MDIDRKEPIMMAGNSNKVNPILKKEPHFQNSAAPATAAVNVDVDANNGGRPARLPPSPFPSEVVSPDNGGSKPETPGKEKKHLKWDEHAIEEHDLLRGTRMKVRFCSCVRIVFQFLDV